MDGPLPPQSRYDPAGQISQHCRDHRGRRYGDRSGGRTGSEKPGHHHGHRRPKLEQRAALPERLRK